MTNEEVAKQIDPEVDEKSLYKHSCPNCYDLDNSAQDEVGWCTAVDCNNCWKYTAKVHGKKVIAVINGKIITEDALPDKR